MKTLLNISLVTIAAIFFNNCNTTEPPSNQTLALKLEDVSCTKAWLTLTTTNYPLPNNITLLINDQPKKKINLVKADTILIVDSLLPNQTYTFITAGNSGLHGISSNKLTATTLDTASHNYTWQTFEFGEGQYSSSVLFDVAIIDENNIWAVGEIYTADTYSFDSLGNWIDPYNAVHWNGSEWELKRIYYKFNGTNLWGPIRALLAFNENDIWFGTNIHWNGQTYEHPNIDALTGWSANKLWGRSSNDLYAVGDNGFLAHYNTGYWQKMESGTNIRLRDIYGTQDGKSIFVCGDDWNTGNSIILDISNFNKPKIILNNIFNQDVSLKEFSCLWTDGKQLILGGSRVYRRYLINNALNSDVVNTEQIPTDYGSREFLPSYFINSLRGTGLNNLFISGDRGMVWHFNGKSWFEYPKLFASNRRFWGSAVKENTVAFVGYSDKALIIIGNR